MKIVKEMLKEIKLKSLENDCQSMGISLDAYRNLFGDEQKVKKELKFLENLPIRGKRG